MFTNLVQSGLATAAAIAISTAALAAPGAADATAAAPSSPEITVARTPAVDPRVREAVAASGTSSVIVGLRASTVPEGDLSGAARHAQRATLHTLRRSIEIRLGSAASRVRGDDEVPFMSMTVDARGLELLASSPEVAHVGEDTEHTIEFGTPTGTTSSHSAPAWWHLRQTSVYSAWEQGYDGAGQTIAVIDTGVQRDHPWLNGKVVAEACFSAARTCPNGSYYEYGAGSARPCTYHSLCGHGTHVAGIAAGKHGIARRASIIAVQVFHPSAQRKPTYAISDLINSLRYVYQMRNSHRIAAVNMSLGGGRHTGYCDDRSNASGIYAWVNALRSVGIATVVATGNDGWAESVSHPACVSNVISVGNTALDGNGQDAVWHSSNASSALVLLAPGTQICSSVPNSSSSCGYTGTSMAAPMVAGAIAALKQLRPGATVTSSINSLHYSGSPVTDSRNGLIRNRINVSAALYWMYTH